MKRWKLSAALLIGIAAGIYVGDWLFFWLAVPFFGVWSLFEASPRRGGKHGQDA